LEKVALFVFNGDPICFIHVLLNALDMKAKGCEAKVIIEGAATGLVETLFKTDNPMHLLWEKAKAAGLVDGVCKACANKTGTLEAAKSQGLALLDEMSGHPGMARYMLAGFRIITF